MNQMTWRFLLLVCLLVIFQSVSLGQWTIQLNSCSFSNLANPGGQNVICAWNGYPSNYDRIRFAASAICQSPCEINPIATAAQLNIGQNGGPCQYTVTFTFSAAVFGATQGNPVPYLAISMYASSTIG